MQGGFNIVTRDVPTMYFFGVETVKSSSRRMFPAWMRILGLPEAQLVGVDLPLNAPPEMYRRAVAQVKYDPLSLGALVTSHKINVVEAARDLFDEFTEDAALCSEVACIYKRGGSLIGHAVDPVNSGASMRQFIPPGYWAEHRADVMCIGAGGSATAITVHFTLRTDPADRPRRMVIINRSQPRLDALRALVEADLAASGIEFEYICNSDPGVNDQLMADLPPYSLVINATGMGKDIPGSPVTGDGLFPQNGIAWELNYRGELDFMHQALRQVETRGVQVEDGWYYFVTGWASVISRVFDVEITPEIYTQLDRAAEAIR